MHTGIEEKGGLGTVFPAWIGNFRVQAVIVAVLAIALYANTFKNEYAFDDSLVIVRNEFVHRGLAGIPDIFSKDSYYSYYKQLNSNDQLSGGRYRPLSIATFALEQQLLGAVGNNDVDSVIQFGLSYEMKAPYEQKFLHYMHVRHVVNVLLFALSMVLLLYFLRYVVFKNGPLAAFLATLLFTIHPIHTEVVANVKSRDEILSLLFICSTFIFAFRYRETKKPLHCVAALASYFLAFLAKEYAITLVVLLPLSFYIFDKETLIKSMKATLPYLAVAVVYLLIRWQITGPRNELSDNDIQINPYALASPAEKLATEIATSLNYIKLLLFPHPLSSDYSYNQIPYKDFSAFAVWFSTLVHLALAGLFVYFFRRRSVLCFAIGFYLLNLLMVNNFIFDIGATMGERLIYHASVGFVIAVAYLLLAFVEKIPAVPVRKFSLTALLAVVVVLCGFATIARNPDWKNDDTLCSKDINTCPNSFLLNANVACMLVNKSDDERDGPVKTAHLQRGVALYTKVIGMQKNYVPGYMNRSAAYFKLNEPDNMLADLDTVYSIYPIHPQLPAMYYHAGILCLDKKQYGKAEIALQNSLKLNPNSGEVRKALGYARQMQQAPQMK